MKTRLMRMMDEQAITGGEEYASRPYGAANLAPILCLAQLAKDPELKNHARIAHETALARYAPVWLDGAMIITSRRSYPDIFNDPMGWRSGSGCFSAGRCTRMPAATRLPPPFWANPRRRSSSVPRPDRSFLVRNRFQEGSCGRQISWVDRTYGLFSESFHTKPRAFGQTYPFGVRWIAPIAGHTMLWFSVPVDEARKGKFPGSHPHGFNVRPNHLSARWLAAVCGEHGREKQARYPYGLAFIPGGELAVIDESATTAASSCTIPECSSPLAPPSPSHGTARRRSAMPAARQGGRLGIPLPGRSLPPPSRQRARTSFRAHRPGAPRKIPRYHPCENQAQLITEDRLTGIYQDCRGHVIRRAFDGAATSMANPWTSTNGPSQTVPGCGNRTTPASDRDRWQNLRLTISPAGPSRNP